jgi:hypothetical protein
VSFEVVMSVILSFAVYCDVTQCSLVAVRQRLLSPSFLYIMGLTDSSLCGSCRAEKETSVHVLCECEALSTLRHAYLGAFVLNPEDVVGLSLELY